TRRNLSKKALALATLSLAAFLTATAAMAADTETASYGYQNGQQQYAARHAMFEEVQSISTDEGREAFFAAKDIGGNGASWTVSSLDVEELVEAGVITQTTADKIMVYASAKHATIHTEYGRKSSMNWEERHSFYEELKGKASNTDAVSELLDAGILTQAEADAINEYLAAAEG
ncbi:MAG: hypothetical protein ACI4V1_09620, partial [Eubacteriales bacterium]